MSPADLDTQTALLVLQEDVERSQRYSVNGRIGVLTTAVLSLNDQAVSTRSQIDGRLSHIESDLDQVKTDVAVLKTDVAGLKTDVAVMRTDLAEVKGNLTLFTDEVRVLIARVEQHAGLIIKDELKGAAPPPAAPKRARPKKQ